MQDIQDMYNQSQKHWFGWDKSIEFARIFETNFPTHKQAGFVQAKKYIQTGFNLLYGS